jgi:hypothetical protein
MNLAIELSAEKAGALKIRAEARGMTVEQLIEYAAKLRASQPPGSIAYLQIIDPEEWLRQFDAWAESHDRTKPPLSDEAISRESIYPDRF